MCYVSVGYARNKLSDKEHISVFPLSFNKLFSRGEIHWFEMGGVISPVLYTRIYDTAYGSKKYAQWTVFPGISVGYRRHIFDSSLSWTYKLNGYILFNKYLPDGMIPHFGVTVGKCF